ncbi:MAG: nucleotidyltransferase family protein [Candidatus Margulisbacteria bacterium]|nr:nucleotidyltransferase family protein [Candidatus Margulisiibacteriota bacterium]
MLSKKKIIKLLASNQSQLKQMYPIKKMGLFGSFARSKQTEESDVDILIEFEKPIGLFTFSRLQLTLSDMLHNNVDLVTPNALKPLIKDKILDEVNWIEAS